jgi:hypothetical protein
MTVIVVSPSVDTSWVRPLATLRSRGVGCVAVTLDADAYDRLAREQEARDAGLRPPEPDQELTELRAKRRRALRHALSEYELPTYTLIPGRPLGEVLVG